MTAVNYLWNPINDNIVREFDDAGNTVAEYTTEPDLYGNVVSQFRNGQTSYLLSDGQGNTTELTNDAGEVTDRIRYSAFGEVVGRTGTTEIPFQYVGQKGYYRDEEIGNGSIRQRPLSARNGRWLTKDPLEIIEALTHAYVYANNSPSTFYDPSGLDPPLGKVKLRCGCLCKPDFGRFFMHEIVVDCSGLGRKCCEIECKRARPPQVRPPFRVKCAFRGRLEDWGLVGATPDTGQDADTCGDDFWDRGYFDCWACCTKSYDFWKTIEAGTACLAFRVKKPHIQPGQRPTQSWLIPLRRRLPKGMRPRLVTVRTVGRLSLYLFIIEGCYDAGVVVSCATLCAAR